MAIPEIPQFDDGVALVLKTLGVPATIIALVLLALALQGWVEGLRQVAEGVRKGGAAVSRGAGALSEMRAARAVASVVITVVVPLAQLLLLGLCYLAGNYISMGFLDRGRWDRLVSVVGTEHLAALRPSALDGILRLDAISGAYLLIGAICLIVSYRRAIGGGSPDGPGRLLGLPAFLLGWLGLLSAAGCGALLLFILGLFGIELLGGQKPDWGSLGDDIRIVLPLAAGIGLCTLYWAACMAGVRGSAVLVRAWTPRAGATWRRFSLGDYLFWG